MLCIHNSVTKQRDIAEVTCKAGHAFKRQVSNIKRNWRCPECLKIEKNKIEEKKFSDKIHTFGFTYISGYNGKKSIVRFSCNHCGNESSSQAESLLKRKKCVNCKYEYTGREEKGHVKTIQEIAKENGIKIAEYSDGKNSISSFTCRNNHTFSMSNKTFRKSPYCRACKRHKENIDRTEKYREKLLRHGLTIHKHTIIKNNTTKFRARCANGHKFTTNIMNLHPKYACPICSNKKMSENKRLSIDEVVKKLDGIGIDYISGDYKNNRSIIVAKCQKEGHLIEKKFGEIVLVNKGCVECRGNLRHSSKEMDLYNFVKGLCPDAKHGDRMVLEGKEIDIYVPSLKIGIEFDGIYWHSDAAGKGKDYHISKTRLAEKKSVKLIHIFENEWDNSADIVKNMIKVKLGKGRRIFARKTVLRRVEKSDEKIFFNSNHIHGFAGSSFCYGLYYEDKLIMAMSFSRSRFSNKADFELTRMASLDDIVVVGGMSKLLKHFDRKVGRSLISYCNIRFSGMSHYNTGYAKTGFTMVHISSPNYFYFKPGKESELFARQNFQKHKLKSKLKVFDESKTEIENMHDNGYAIIFDCGNLVFIRRKPPLL